MDTLRFPVRFSPWRLPSARRFSLGWLFRPEVVYPVLLLVWGTLLALLLPPIQCPDEGSHAIRSFHHSRGRIHPDGVKDGFHTGRAPACLLRMCEWMGPRTYLDSPLRRLTAEEWHYLSSVRLKDEPEEATWYGMMSYTCFVPYVPQATGVYLARKLGGSLLTAFYAGRLANLLVCVLALHLALRLMPFYKNLLGVVALLPISVQQMATLSADALGLAACFVFTALMFRLFVPADRKPGWVELLGLCLTAVLLPICKVPYALLTLLYLGVRPSRLGSWRRYLLMGCGLAAAVVLGAIITLKAAEGATRLGEGVPLPDVSRYRQASLVYHHPEVYFLALGRTITTWGWAYCESLTLISGNVYVNRVPGQAYLLFLAVLALVDRRQGWTPPFRVRLLAVAISSMALMLFLLMLYLVWTRVGYPLIDGFQGRYFIGFLPVLLLPFYNRIVAAQVGPRALLGLAGAAVSGVQLATLHTLINTYYFVSGTLFLSFLVVGSVLFLSTLFAVCWSVEKAQCLLEEVPGQEPMPVLGPRWDRGAEAGSLGSQAPAANPMANSTAEARQLSAAV